MRRNVLFCLSNKITGSKLWRLFYVILIAYKMSSIFHLKQILLFAPDSRDAGLSCSVNLRGPDYTSSMSYRKDYSKNQTTPIRLQWVHGSNSGCSVTAPPELLSLILVTHCRTGGSYRGDRDIRMELVTPLFC